MQTFLPYSNFAQSAKCLDYRRLGKQRSEALSIFKILIGEAKKNKNGKIPWENHPAVKMWKGHEFLLLAYILVICKEWQRRKYKDTVLEKSLKLADKFRKKIKNNYVLEQPNWFFNEKFHASHRSNLLRKNKEYYSQFNWKEPDNLPYYWPVK